MRIVPALPRLPKVVCTYLTKASETKGSLKGWIAMWMGMLIRPLCTLHFVFAAVKLAQRRRAALDPDFASFHYLRDEVAERLVDRLADINKAFPVAVEIGCGTGAHVSKLISTITSSLAQQAADARARAAAASEPAAAAAAKVAAAGASSSSSSSIAPPTVSAPNRGKIGTLHICDSCPEALERTRAYWHEHAAEKPPDREHVYTVVDEEGPLPFKDGSVDLIISSMSMHWINDLPGFLRKCKQALKPDGVFLAAMIGGATLQELRSVCSGGLVI
jgi:SAM-dependent methyltransferase